MIGWWPRLRRRRAARSEAAEFERLMALVRSGVDVPLPSMPAPPEVMRVERESPMDVPPPWVDTNAEAPARGNDALWADLFVDPPDVDYDGGEP